ncbi:MAG: hypothetical protein A2912_01385 [Candidatus Buchananbacteria bacterium RIFCSPLOWO2_01_FULL_40_23b]|uniref:Teneurin-like YD-shell domain-containing protein n=1 Tax=Candidatus Buchananbacteria bacterium RIFCSPLOWO2_01_FULL_40_23b TaxID=1797544 RepID=A0A1G1YN01_9BACT|nr:MAG: hypothetical protein A2912_01385 [Candidatus Buchananbacteria bacterium RIFCSPLOWO2_01_FULL_40_23b]
MQHDTKSAKLILLLFTLLFIPFALAATQTLIYDSTQNNITLNYDNLNRIHSKNSSTINTAYGYDQEFNGVLSNVTKGDVNVTYQYDEKLRVIKETVTIDGLSFTREFLYDSADRIISTVVQNQDIDLLFSAQGKIRQIPSFVNDAHYTPFGSILNRTYNNNLVQNFLYDDQNNRLKQIDISGVMNMNYTYDNVGNILTIHDAVQKRGQNLTYDSLDRLISAKIGSDTYTYAYNPTGNIMKIVKNNESKKFVYDNKGHAPTEIIENPAAGIDIYKITEQENTTKNRTFEFYLVTDSNQSLTNVNWTVDFGARQVSSGPITIDGTAKVAVSHNYTTGGEHSFNVTAESPGVKDFETNTPSFGAKAKKLTALYTNGTERIFEFEVKNELKEDIAGLNWNCSHDLVSLFSFSLSGNQSLYDYMHVNFTSPGKKNFSCSTSSNDGSQTISTEVDIKGIEVEHYDVLAENVSRKIIAFDARNYFTSLEANISIVAENAVFSRKVNISRDDFVMVISEVNFTSDGDKSYNINVIHNNTDTTYASTFTEEGAVIENYTRIDNGTQQKFIFFIKNNWHAGNVTWTFTNPSTSATVSMGHNETRRVQVQHNYTTHGWKDIEITAQVSTFKDILQDSFEIRPLFLERYETLSEGTNSVSEAVIENILNQSQTISWQYSGNENVTSNKLIVFNASRLFVFIASNSSSSGVYRTDFTVNSTLYNDTIRGVIVS